jgi:hypothetical protein
MFANHKYVQIQWNVGNPNPRSSELTYNTTQKIGISKNYKFILITLLLCSKTEFL